MDNLKAAGANPKNIIAYALMGHPDSDIQQLEDSLKFANSLGIKVMLSEFSPIPGTRDGDRCSKMTDISEPLTHSKTAFPIRLLGNEKVNRIKDLCRTLNGGLGANISDNQ